MMAQKRWLYNKLINPECSDGYLAVQSEDFDDNSEVEEFSLIGNRKVLLSETQKMNQSHRIRKNFDNFHLDSRTCDGELALNLRL
ncbi:hypothetical protein PV326_004253 [Microctonus aethiopoides]|nr:hypothetical protein PV326_004253 [Microctonus aethiopoides]